LEGYAISKERSSKGKSLHANGPKTALTLKQTTTVNKNQLERTITVLQQYGKKPGGIINWTDGVDLDEDDIF